MMVGIDGYMLALRRVQILGRQPLNKLTSFQLSLASSIVHMPHHEQVAGFCGTSQTTPKQAYSAESSFVHIPHFEQV